MKHCSDQLRPVTCLFIILDKTTTMYKYALITYHMEAISVDNTFTTHISYHLNTISAYTVSMLNACHI